VRRPNILLILTDQQRWDALGCNGNPDIQTPNLDRLAADGANLDYCFVQSPVCSPSRASLLTGLYPATLGILHNGVPVPENAITLPRLLRNYGYTSANIGKLHFLPHANRNHREIHPSYGFDHLEISDEPGCYDDAYRAWVRHKAPDQADRISVGLPPAAHVWYQTMSLEDPVVHPVEGPRFDFREVTPFPADEELTHTAFVAEQTIQLLRQRPAGPFFCVAGFYSPHAPWVVPQRFLDLYEPSTFRLPAFPEEVEAQRGGTLFSDRALRSARHGYYAMVSEVDTHAGRILAALDELDLSENTLVVFTSDHGEWLGEHLRYGKGFPAHDCISRVPCLIRWSSEIAEPGRTIASLVEAVDIVPTLLECIGIPLPPHLQGRSFLSHLRGTGGVPSAGAPRRSALTEMEGWKTLRSEAHRYVVQSDGTEALYDLSGDPGGYRNVVHDAAYAPVLNDFRHELVIRLLQRERPRARVWPY
jgi:arylsulfatase A-like enzyme